MDEKDLLSGIDEELLRNFKVVCSFDGISMKVALTNFMRNIVRDFEYDFNIDISDRFKLDKRIPFC